LVVCLAGHAESFRTARTALGATNRRDGEIRKRRTQSESSTGGCSSAPITSPAAARESCLGPPGLVNGRTRLPVYGWESHCERDRGARVHRVHL